MQFANHYPFEGLLRTRLPLVWTTLGGLPIPGRTIHPWKGLLPRRNTPTLKDYPYTPEGPLGWHTTSKLVVGILLKCFLFGHYTLYLLCTWKQFTFLDETSVMVRTIYPIRCKPTHCWIGDLQTEFCFMHNFTFWPF